MVVSRMYRRRLVVEMSQKRLNGKMYFFLLRIFFSIVLYTSSRMSRLKYDVRSSMNNNKHGGKEVCFSGLEARI
jgi:IS4 transposase